jgi:hypothetical protein
MLQQDDLVTRCGTLSIKIKLNVGLYPQSASQHRRWIAILYSFSFQKEYMAAVDNTIVPNLCGINVQTYKRCIVREQRPQISLFSYWCRLAKNITMVDRQT